MPYSYPPGRVETFSKDLSYGDMEATLMHLVFDVAAVLIAEIPQHLAEHPFQGIILNLSARLVLGLNLLVSVVADIERGAIKMARILGGITITGSQFRHIILGAQDARYNISCSNTEALGTR